MNENNSHIDNENLNPLDHISKKNNFKIPAGYFEGLASKLENELEIKNSKSPKRSIVRTMIINVSIAAAVVVGVFIFRPSPKPIEPVQDLGEAVTVDDFMNSMIEEDLDSYSIATVVVLDDVDHEIAALLDTEFSVSDDVTQDEILDYFEEDWDPSDYEL
jgi:hypothetical protein